MLCSRLLQTAHITPPRTFFALKSVNSYSLILVYRKLYPSCIEASGKKIYSNNVHFIDDLTEKEAVEKAQEFMYKEICLECGKNMKGCRIELN